MKKSLVRILSLALVVSMLAIGAQAANFESVADQLNTLGVFQGTATGYQLDRAPTRAEAATMLVRLLGKETGMDAQRGKQTWPAAFGVERSRQDAGTAIEQAVQALSPFGERGAYLRELARKTLVRKA